MQNLDAFSLAPVLISSTTIAQSPHQRLLLHFYSHKGFMLPDQSALANQEEEIHTPGGGDTHPEVKK